MNGSLTIRADAKMSVKPVITFLLVSEVETSAAAKFGLVNQTSGLCLTISAVIYANSNYPCKQCHFFYRGGADSTRVAPVEVL